MAEFSEVMRQYRRFCKSHSNCGECQFDNKSICGEVHLSDVPFEEIEREIMRWAAEHPEPVYPTWYQYFRSIGMGSATGGYVADWVLTTHIPADIAEKLGIEPMEG